MNQIGTVRDLTADEIVDATLRVPKHRRDILDGLRTIYCLVNRGISIKTTAPAWVQAQNVIFVDEGDGDDSTV